MDEPFALPHEESLSSERGFDGKLVHVRVDRVRLPSGQEGVREVVEHPGAVAILALTTDGQVVLIRQWRHAIGRAMIEIPAGTREPGEAPEVTARRELLEETGYVASSIRPVATFYASPGYCDEEIALFVANECEPGERPSAPDERTELILVPVDDAIHMVGFGADRTQDAKTHIALLWLANHHPTVKA